MNLIPTQLKLIAPDQLQITWNDGAEHQLPVARLRDHCPCASCRERRSGGTTPDTTNLLNVVPIEETRPVHVQSMKPVGHYAYSIGFSDGHDTGIFTLEFLRELGEMDS